MEDGSPCFSSTAIHWHQWPAARCCCGRYTTRFLEPHDDRGNDGINYMYLSLFSLPPPPPPLSLSLFPPLHPCLSFCLSVCLSASISISLSLGNKPTKTYSESKKTHASVTLAGACEVINSRGGPWSRPPAGHLVLSAMGSAISKLFIETKLSFLQGDFGY